MAKAKSAKKTEDPPVVEPVQAAAPVEKKKRVAKKADAPAQVVAVEPAPTENLVVENVTVVSDATGLSEILLSLWLSFRHLFQV